MDFVPDGSHADPVSWRVATEASAGKLSMNTSKGSRLLHELPRFHGSFTLSRAGLLAGFALRLPLPPGARPAWLRAEEPPLLSWESVGLSAGGPPSNVGGRARLRLGRRETFTPVWGLCAEVPAGRPYFKIVLETVFPSSSLHWPAEAWRRLRPVTLTLFSEIRPSGAGTREPPR
ncbi:hypothetical protein HNP84_002139 [Thermocatellispora tengchongensis]|uniref:Uncharacterized protein n=1 Tax=Thermocatellispora tengchongensis TaxID=1073253 RepID=A0A840P3F5_9ACTN|nr:hypothetical protein [Thermocatellispora tengchongensis]MBB5132423.1 hypothetical protein [Thermocatellispora tengchongensis]